MGYKNHIPPQDQLIKTKNLHHYYHISILTIITINIMAIVIFTIIIIIITFFELVEYPSLILLSGPASSTEW